MQQVVVRLPISLYHPYVGHMVIIPVRSKFSDTLLIYIIYTIINTDFLFIKKYSWSARLLQCRLHRSGQHGRLHVEEPVEEGLQAHGL